MIELRVYVDAEDKLNGELVGRGQQTTFRPTSTPHKFLQADADDIWVLFTIENGRATLATMHERGREISGPRTPPHSAAWSLHTPDRVGTNRRLGA